MPKAWWNGCEDGKQVTWHNNKSNHSRDYNAHFTAYDLKGFVGMKRFRKSKQDIADIEALENDKNTESG